MDDFFKDLDLGESADRARQNFVRRNVDGLKYIAKYTKLEKSGGLRKCCCPLHHERTPSFIVYPKGYRGSDGVQQQHTSFYCFGCHAGGDVIEFKRHLDGLPSRAAACVALEHELGLVYDDTDELAELRFELVDAMAESSSTTLSLTEINMLCSIATRQYLRTVAEHKPDLLDLEFKAVEGLHTHIDVQLGELSAREAAELPAKVNEMITYRLRKLELI